MLPYQQDPGYDELSPEERRAEWHKRLAEAKAATARYGKGNTEATVAAPEKKKKEASSEAGTLEVPQKLSPSPTIRKWVYGLLSALVPVSVAYGVFSETEAGLWLAVAGALLGTGGSLLASANTPK